MSGETTGALGASKPRFWTFRLPGIEDLAPAVEAEAGNIQADVLQEEDGGPEETAPGGLSPDSPGAQVALFPSQEG